MQCTEHYWFIFPNFTCDPGQRDPNNDQRLDFAKLGCYSDTAMCCTRGLPGLLPERLRAATTFPGSSRVLLRHRHVLHPQTSRAAFREAPSSTTLPGVPPGFPGEREYATCLSLRTARRGKSGGRARAGKKEERRWARL